jgi:hypothetical protein
MRSGDRSRALDLDRDLPTTAEDVAALRRAATLSRLDLGDYLRFLSGLPPAPAAALRSERRQAADPPFELF